MIFQNCLMKKKLLVFFLFLSTGTYAQSAIQTTNVSRDSTASVSDTTSKPEKIYHFTDVSPRPEKGIESFQKYLERNTRYPTDARNYGIQGSVVYQFVINEDGTMSDITILKDIGGGCGDELKSVLEKCSLRWNPGKIHGKPVKTCYSGIFNFMLK